MSLTFKLRTAEFGAQLAEIARVTGREAGEVVRAEGKLFVADVIRMTPPFGTAPSTESLGSQRKVGEAAVERDIRGFFGLVPPLEKIRSPAIRQGVERATRRRDWEGLKQILRNTKMGPYAESVSRDPDAAVHQAARDRRGRIRAAGAMKRFWVVSEAALKRLIRAKKAMVGKAKSGWTKAARGLGFNVPNWISRHSGPGEFVDRTKDAKKPMIRVGNAVDYVQGTGAQLQIVRRALQNRMRNMRAKLARVVRSGWKRR